MISFYFENAILFRSRDVFDMHAAGKNDYHALWLTQVVVWRNNAIIHRGESVATERKSHKN